MVPEIVGVHQGIKAEQQAIGIVVGTESWELTCKQETQEANYKEEGEATHDLKVFPKQHASCRKIAPPKAPQTAPPTRNQVFKYPRLLGSLFI